MKNRRTPEQWQSLIAKRGSFTGTNIEFCRRHGISITSFYKHQACIRNQSTSSFVQVKTTTEQTRFETHGEVQFDVHSGKLTLPASLSAAQIVAIIKGITQ